METMQIIVVVILLALVGFGGFGLVKLTRWVAANVTGGASNSLPRPIYLQSWFIIAVAAVLLVGGVGISQTPPPAPVAKAVAALKSLTYLRSASDPNADDSYMDLYSVKGSLDIEELKSVCKSKLGSKHAFHMVVVFDDAKNADLPSQPFTAMYGIEEKKMVHIRAIYVLNTKNGYSVLTTWEPNAWEGKPQEIRI